MSKITYIVIATREDSDLPDKLIACGLKSKKSAIDFINNFKKWPESFEAYVISSFSKKSLPFIYDGCEGLYKDSDIVLDNSKKIKK